MTNRSLPTVATMEGGDPIFSYSGRIQMGPDKVPALTPCRWLISLQRRGLSNVHIGSQAPVPLTSLTLRRSEANVQVSQPCN